jgi:hypothetical protein
VKQRWKRGSNVTDDRGRLLLTEEEWLARMKISGGENSEAGEKGGGKNDRGGKNGSKSTRAIIKCTHCSKKGHEADVCWSKAKKAQAKIAKGEEDDDGPSLFMAHVVAIDTEDVPKPPGSEPVHRLPPPVELIEAKVLAKLDDGGDHNDTVWYLDSGATNHMCGARSAFSHLDTNVMGTVSFGDRSMAKIEGRGMILFVGKDGSHRLLTRVYFIPRLTSNIISLGQLDKAGCNICIRHGLLKIHDDNRRMVAKVSRTSSQLYILKLQLARPVCLAVHHDDSAWLWHECYGHLHFDALRKLARDGMVRGLP